MQFRTLVFAPAVLVAIHCARAFAQDVPPVTENQTESAAPHKFDLECTGTKSGRYLGKSVDGLTAQIRYSVNMDSRMFCRPRSVSETCTQARGIDEATTNGTWIGFLYGPLRSQLPGQTSTYQEDSLDAEMYDQAKGTWLVTIRSPELNADEHIKGSCVMRPFSGGF